MFQEEGGKRSLRKGNAFLLFSPVAAVGIALTLLPKPIDTSFVEHTSKNLTDEAKRENDREPSENHAKGINGVSDSLRVSEKMPHSSDRNGSNGMGDSTHGSGGGIKYHAIQVVQRQGGDPGKLLPIGTSFIGRLLTGIDTREQNSLARVIIPYGGSFDHERHIDKNSVLFGNVSYSGTGEKVYIKFNRILYPDGKEFKIEAQALSSADYSPGILGEENDGAGERVGATVGLTMFSGMTDALVEKQALSPFWDATAKPNLRNGFYNGLSKATNEEAQRRAAKMNDVKDYVTVPAGLDLIISLTETFKGESL